jgi:hypothetical protein
MKKITSNYVKVGRRKKKSGAGVPCRVASQAKQLSKPSFFLFYLILPQREEA